MANRCKDRQLYVAAWMRNATVAAILVAASSATAAPAPGSHRTFTPADLFRVRQVMNVSWASDGAFASLELTRPARRIGDAPTSEIGLLDVARKKVRVISAPAARYVGFFNASWSPDGRRLAFLSVDTTARVRLWIWTRGTVAPRAMKGLDPRAGFGEAPIAWIDDSRLAVIAWNEGAEKTGTLYWNLLQGRNAISQWRRGRNPRWASASVLASGRPVASTAPVARLVLLNLATQARRILVQGSLHNVAASRDGRHIAYYDEQRGVPARPAAAFLDMASHNVDEAYVAINRGPDLHVLDASSGREVDASVMGPTGGTPPPKLPAGFVRPRSDARWLSVGPGGAALALANAADGSLLWLCGGARRSPSPCIPIWRANQWMATVDAGISQSFSYKAEDGTALTGWLLLPPGYKQGERLPLVAIVYPGSVYNLTQPPSLSLYQAAFWGHPQLFAALGYAVLLPSIPPSPGTAEEKQRVIGSVMPAIDAVIAMGVADRNRLAVAGQSEGGYATLGLVGQSDRFRSAIASAGFSDLVSLYGTFYGQYRNGDAGAPQKGEILRMLQMERGSFNLGNPPWAAPDLYREASPIMDVGKVRTPVMLIHGSLDFIPIEQDEEFFTALYRQGVRAEFVRYAGEGHVISRRANVLDLWRRIAAWLSETMRPRPLGR